MIIYKFLKYLILNIRYTKILKEVYKNENLIQNLSNLFGVNFKIDWIGRIYAVINPNIVNGVYDPNTQIFEYNESGLSNTLYIEKWIMERLNVAEKFIQANNLFDLLTYKIEKLDDYNNHLFIIQPITLEDCLTYLKRFLLVYSVLIIICVILFIIFLIFF